MGYQPARDKWPVPSYRDPAAVKKRREVPIMSEENKIAGKSQMSLASQGLELS
jgi:hypothetical protein